MGVCHFIARNDLLCAIEVSTHAGHACFQLALHWSKSVHRLIEYYSEFLHLVNCICACLDRPVLRT